jgi:hypothetical protein
MGLARPGERELPSVIDRLAAHSGDGAVVTLTLDVSKSSILPAPTRIFFKNRVLKSLAPEGRAQEERAALEALTSRLTAYVGSIVRPETNGVYVAAGGGLWESLELQVPLPNFLHQGRAPYLAPLLEALDRGSRCWVARGDERECRLDAFEMGVWTEIDRWAPAAVERDAERIVTGRSPASASGTVRAKTSVGGGKRDRFEQSLEAETSRALEALARRLATLDAARPATALFWFGDAEHFREFRNHLPSAIRSRAEHLGPLPRKENHLREKVERTSEKRVLDRRAAEVSEFQERRAQGHLVALGPGDILAHRSGGRLVRLFVDAQNPVMGRECRPCGSLYAGLESMCGFCGGPTVPASVTQDVVARAWTHPPLPITFVSGSEKWLKDLGGMAGLLSQKGMRVRR